MMQGAAPVSAGSLEQLERLIAAFAEDAAARHSSSRRAIRPRCSTSCASLDNEVSRKLSGYLDLVGYRLLDGFDISGRYALELPDALLRAIRPVRRREVRRSLTSTPVSPESAGQVPEEHAAEFDELLGEARLMYRIRDERGVFSDIWASGIMRRAVLAAGRRLAGTGPDRRPRALHRCRLRRNGFDAVRCRRSLRRRSWRRASSTEPPTPPRKPRRCWARHPCRRRTRPACRPGWGG